MMTNDIEPGLSLPPVSCPGVVCTATTTHRARLEDSQDAAAVAQLWTDGSPAVLVADGLGSFARAGEAARFAVLMAQRLLQGHEPELPRPGSLAALFPQVQARLARFAQEQDSRLTDAANAVCSPAQSWGTTLLAAMDTPTALYAGYVGNGGLFHLRGNFAEYGDGIAPPWCCVNYLNPHSVCEEGREALYRYLAAEITPGQAEPTLLALGKDDRYGDLLLLCTDGLFSQDQVRWGDPGDGSLWSEVNAPLRAVLAALRACFLEPKPVTRTRLQIALQGCLSDLRERQMLEDDATVGLLVTGRALTYQSMRTSG